MYRVNFTFTTVIEIFSIKIMSTVKFDMIQGSAI